MGGLSLGWRKSISEPGRCRLYAARFGFSGLPRFWKICSRPLEGNRSLGWAWGSG